MTASLACGGGAASSIPLSPVNAPHSHPSPAPGTAGGQAAFTAVTEKTACEAMNPTSCVGAYGFTIQQDGSYTAGPSPTGQTQSGQVSGAELSQIAADIGAFTAQDLASPLQCESKAVTPGIADTVSVAFPDQTYVMYDGMRLVSPVGSVCTAGDRTRALKLHADLQALLKEYYPNPFPG